MAKSKIELMGNNRLLLSFIIFDTALIETTQI